MFIGILLDAVGLQGLTTRHAQLSSPSLRAHRMVGGAVTMARQGSAAPLPSPQNRHKDVDHLAGHGDHHLHIIASKALSPP